MDTLHKGEWKEMLEIQGRQLRLLQAIHGEEIGSAAKKG
jgi:hypothetical protein